MLKKLKKKNGETLIESMVALVIIVFVISMLPMAVVTAAKINHSAKSIKTICSETKRTTADTEAGEESAPAANYTANVTISTVTGSGDSAVTAAGTLENSYTGYLEDGFYYYSK